MAVITLVSAKGSPGVTTTAAALVASAELEPAIAAGVLVELDPSGGDVEIEVGARTGDPALLAAAAEARRRVTGDLAAHAVAVRPGLRGVLAPTTARSAGPVVADVGGRLPVAIARSAGWVVVDAGRWDPTQPAAHRVEGADVLGVVCRSTAPSIAHALNLLDHLELHRRVLVMVGDQPYGPEAVNAEAPDDVPVLGPVAWDVEGVHELWSGGASRRWMRASRRRPTLAHSARRLLDELIALATPSAPPADVPAHLASSTPAPGREALR